MISYRGQKPDCTASLATSIVLDGSNRHPTGHGLWMISILKPYTVFPYSIFAIRSSG